jgi:lipopolysaccharide export system protein LptA
MVRVLKILTLLLTLCSLSLEAAAPVQTRNDKLRPKGPVTVTADRAEFDKTGVMVYTGNVLLVADNLQLKGDRLELRQFPADQYEAKLKGSLAHMEQSGDVDEKGQPLPPMVADGQDMVYDTRTGLLDITGQAKAVRGKNEVNGNTIRYNVNERRVQANGGQGGQVKIIIQSPPGKTSTSGVQKSPAATTVPKTISPTASAVSAPQPAESSSAPTTIKP